MARTDPDLTVAGGTAGGAPMSGGSPGGAPAVGTPDGNQGQRSLTPLHLTTLALGIGMWFLAVALTDNELLPSPAAVGRAVAEGLQDGALVGHVLTSLRRVLLGFLAGVALAVPAGFLMGWYRWARGLIEPWIQFFRTIPPLALIPLVILFLGIGEGAKVFVIFLASFLACVIATFQGVRNVDATLLNAARVLGAGDATIFLRVVVPASTPYIFVGMRIALGSAWATLVASELIAASRGLGRMMQSAAQFLDTPTIVVGILAIGGLGFAMDRLLLVLERRLTSWQEVRA